MELSESLKNLKKLHREYILTASYFNHGTEGVPGAVLDDEHSIKLKIEGVVSGLKSSKTTKNRSRALSSLLLILN